MLKPYQSDFIRFALDHKVLQFGRFKLKSGRSSPYFFNLAALFEGKALRRLCDFYALALAEAGGVRALKVDALFGLAYKGIPLASALAMRLAEDDLSLPCLFDRKEHKDHGEGGQIIGTARLGQHCLIIDDVLTAGTAIQASLPLLASHQLEARALLVALDREERVQPDRPASARATLEVAGLSVVSIVDMTVLMDWLLAEGSGEMKQAYHAMRDYRRIYGGD